MNPYLKNLSRIEFVVTTVCSGKCRHCSQGDIRSSEHIDKDIACEAVFKIASEYNITSLMTFGGESLLYPETVCAIHRTATEMGIPKRQLITNGYFSRDYDKINSVAMNLADSCVNEILLSVDAFHQESIPLGYVIAFAEAVLATGTPIKVQPAWLISADDDNPYNITTRDILSEFNSMGIETNEGNVIFPSGNALRYLSEYFDKDNLPKNPYEEDPTDIRAICFSANGDILGENIYEKDINTILHCYAPKK